jgi:hypothetical protein
MQRSSGRSRSYVLNSGYGRSTLTTQLRSGARRDQGLDAHTPHKKRRLGGIVEEGKPARRCLTRARPIDGAACGSDATECTGTRPVIRSRGARRSGRRSRPSLGAGDRRIWRVPVAGSEDADRRFRVRSPPARRAFCVAADEQSGCSRSERAFWRGSRIRRRRGSAVMRRPPCKRG